jgi:hypothetical protein
LRPPAVCCLNDTQLDQLKSQCKEYEEEALKVCGAPIGVFEQLEINLEEQKAYLQMVEQVRKQRLEEIRGNFCLFIE